MNPGAPLPPLKPPFEGVLRYIDPYTGCVTAKLLPGQFFVGGSLDRITTVVGSSVTVCLFDMRARCGGMLQLLVAADPSNAGPLASGGFNVAEREAFDQLDALVSALERRGARRERLRAKLFGAAMLDPGMADSSRESLRLAREYLRTDNIREDSADTGMLHARKVVFFPAEGRVRLKKLPELPNDTLLRREREHHEMIINRRSARAVDRD